MPSSAKPVGCRSCFCFVLCIQPSTHIVVRSLSLPLPAWWPVSGYVFVLYDTDLGVGQSLKTQVANWRAIERIENKYFTIIMLLIFTCDLQW